MASTVLPNGIIVPEKFSRDWYADLYHNWQELDNLLGGGTPKDGTLTIQKNGDTVGTFSANQATDETINITVPDVNDATLTIQQNGTTVDTFTANSSSDKTVDIQCVDLTNNQTVAGNKEFTGTTTAHDVIPSATDTYNFGSSSYQWNNAYIKSLTINGVVAGDILTYNASEFVNVSSNQTIGGQKIFATSPIGVGRDLYHFAQSPYSKNTPPVNTSYQYVFFSGNSASQGFTNQWYSGFIEQVVGSNGQSRGRWLVRRTDETSASIELLAGADDTLSLKPTLNNAMMLGVANQAWKDCYTKAINGINPGALSLPSMTYISLDTTEFDVTSTTIGTFASTVDGWAILSITQKNKPFGIWVLNGGYRATFQSVHHNTDYMIFALIPVRANINTTIYCTADDIDSTRKVDWLRLFPCQGNV